ncbi:MAG: MBL fold metallo-hydrolase, partial [Chloroflexota bacterium]
MKQISSKVYVEDQWSVPPRCRGSNWGFVTTSAGIVMIDSPMVPRTAVEWRDKIAEMGEVRYLIDTHHHVDHITGNFFFPGEVVSSEGVRQMFTAPFEKVGN